MRSQAEVRAFTPAAVEGVSGTAHTGGASELFPGASEELAQTGGERGFQVEEPERWAWARQQGADAEGTQVVGTAEVKGPVHERKAGTEGAMPG